MKRTIFVATLFLLASVCAGAQTDALIDPATAAQHLLKQPQPIYPPIAAVAHIDGTLAILATVDQNGLVSSAHVLSGPAMLQTAGKYAVQGYTFTPFQLNGKPAGGMVLVSISFMPSGKVSATFASKEGDENASIEFFQAFDQCNRQVGEQAPVVDQIGSCQKAAQQADILSGNLRAFDRVLAYVQYATALIRDDNSAEAVQTGNKAIAVAKQQPMNSSGASAAYGITGEALAVAGDLKGADQNLTKAEKYEHERLERTSFMASRDTRETQVLKGLLQFHAKILTEMGKQKEAKSKLKQAAKL